MRRHSARPAQPDIEQEVERVRSEDAERYTTMLSRRTPPKPRPEPKHQPRLLNNKKSYAKQVLKGVGWPNA